MYQIVLLIQISFLLFSRFLLCSARNVIRINKFEDVEWRTLGITIPKDCSMFGLCENVSHFPEKLISYKIKELKNKNTTFHGDRIKPRISFRSGFNDDEDIDLCHSFPKSLYPKMGKNVDGEWRYILNTDDEKVQQFNAEVCRYYTQQNGKQFNRKFRHFETPVTELCPDETRLHDGINAAIGSECSSLVKFVRDTHGKCVQKYMQRKMYALNMNTREVVQEFFSVPIYCTCVARYI